MNPLSYIYLSILSISSVIGLICYFLFSKPLKIVSLYVVLTLIIELIGYYCLYFSLERKVNVYLYNVYIPIGFSLLSLFFYLIVKSQFIKRIIFLVIPIIVSVNIFFIIQSPKPELNRGLFLYLKGLLIIYSIIYLHQIINSEESISSNSNFWVVTGIIFFYSGYFFLSGFIDYISKNNLQLAQKLFILNPLLNIIYYSLITYGFICQRRLAKSLL